MTSIGKRKAYAMLRILEDARQSATMERASFNLGSGFFGNDKDTDSIRRATRLFRESWIIGPLDEVIDMLKAEIGNE